MHAKNFGGGLITKNVLFDNKQEKQFLFEFLRICFFLDLTVGHLASLLMLLSFWLIITVWLDLPLVAL
eukprot:m.80352 g.80352  ORF g.80352 m.80352 type:complete len:68 (+) comp36188_c0_seq46:1434-1637(+)